MEHRVNQRIGGASRLWPVTRVLKHQTLHRKLPLLAMYPASEWNHGHMARSPLVVRQSQEITEKNRKRTAAISRCPFGQGADNSPSSQPRNPRGTAALEDLTNVTSTDIGPVIECGDTTPRLPSCRARRGAVGRRFFCGLACNASAKDRSANLIPGSPLSFCPCFR